MRTLAAFLVASLLAAPALAKDPPLECSAPGGIVVFADMSDSSASVLSSSRRLVGHAVFGPSEATPAGGHARPIEIHFAGYGHGDKRPKDESLTEDSILAAIARGTLTVYPPAAAKTVTGTCK